MKFTDKLRKVSDVGRALMIHRELNRNASLTRIQLKYKKFNQLKKLLNFTINNSPFYQKFYESIDINCPTFQLNSLPVLTKTKMMDHLDDVFTDRNLKRSDLFEHIKKISQQTYYKNKYRVVSSTGSSGKKGIGVFDRKEWSHALALTIRWMNALGVSFKFPPKSIKVASIGASDPIHLSYALVQSLDFGLHNVLRLEANDPVEKIIDDLNKFKPEVIHAYPSILALIATDSRLKINPKVICTSSELRTDLMEEAIRKKWPKSKLFNCYGMLETTVSGLNCHLEQGIHLLDDYYILENVDSQNKPVLPGKMGDKILITNLYNFTQPLIRYEISDKLMFSTEKCSCGSSYPLVKDMGGKSEDILYFKDQNSKWIKVHWSLFKNAMLKLPFIIEYQFIQHEKEIDIRIVAQDIERNKIESEVQKAIKGTLNQRNLRIPKINIKIVSQIKRSQEKMGKLKVIISKFCPQEFST